MPLNAILFIYIATNWDVPLSVDASGHAVPNPLGIALIPDVERQTYYENILVDLSHETDIRMVNFLRDSIDVFLHSISKKLKVNL